jgi:hypothetical protein
VLIKARERFQSLGLESKIPEGMIAGWPFRFVSSGKVFYYRTLVDEEGATQTYQRGKDITPTDLQDALGIFHNYKYPVRIDREHDMSNPRGIVLDIFESLDAEGNPCLACIPAYNAELANYVKECNGLLYSSPSIEWSDDAGHFADQKTGELMGKFRINALAICVDPGQAPRILDTVRLTQTKDSVIVHTTATKESIPVNTCELYNKSFNFNAVIVEEEATIPEAPASNTEDIMDPEVQKYVDEQLAALRDMYEVFKTEVMERLDKLEGKEEEVEETEASDEEPTEEVASLRRELDALKTEKLSREATDAISKLKLRKCDQENARKAFIAEKLGKGADLGFKPFTDVFAKMAPMPSSGTSGHSSSTVGDDFLALVESYKKAGDKNALAIAIGKHPEAFQRYQDNLNK